MATEPYEVLIRMRGGQTYAHTRTLTIADGNEYENPPVDLAVSGPEFNAFKTQFNAAVMAENQALRNQLAQCLVAIEQLGDRTGCVGRSGGRSDTDRDATVDLSIRVHGTVHPAGTDRHIDGRSNRCPGCPDPIATPDRPAGGPRCAADHRCGRIPAIDWHPDRTASRPDSRLVSPATRSLITGPSSWLIKL